MNIASTTNNLPVDSIYKYTKNNENNLKSELVKDLQFINNENSETGSASKNFFINLNHPASLTEKDNKARAKQVLASIMETRQELINNTNKKVNYRFYVLSDDLAFNKILKEEFDQSKKNDQKNADPSKNIIYKDSTVYTPKKNKNTFLRRGLNYIRNQFVQNNNISNQIQSILNKNLAAQKDGTKPNSADALNYLMLIEKNNQSPHFYKLDKHSDIYTLTANTAKSTSNKFEDKHQQLNNNPNNPTSAFPILKSEKLKDHNNNGRYETVKNHANENKTSESKPNLINTWADRQRKSNLEENEIFKYVPVYSKAKGERKYRTINKDFSDNATTQTLNFDKPNALNQRPNYSPPPPLPKSPPPKLNTSSKQIEQSINLKLDKLLNELNIIKRFQNKNPELQNAIGEVTNIFKNSFYYKTDNKFEFKMTSESIKTFDSHMKEIDEIQKNSKDQFTKFYLNGWMSKLNKVQNEFKQYENLIRDNHSSSAINNLKKQAPAASPQQQADTFVIQISPSKKSQVTTDNNAAQKNEKVTFQVPTSPAKPNIKLEEKASDKNLNPPKTSASPTKPESNSTEANGRGFKFPRITKLFSKPDRKKGITESSKESNKQSDKKAKDFHKQKPSTSALQTSNFVSENIMDEKDVRVAAEITIEKSLNAVWKSLFEFMDKKAYSTELNETTKAIKNILSNSFSMSRGKFKFGINPHSIEKFNDAFNRIYEFVSNKNYTDDFSHTMSEEFLRNLSVAQEALQNYCDNFVNRNSSTKNNTSLTSNSPNNKSSEDADLHEIEMIAKKKSENQINLQSVADSFLIKPIIDFNTRNEIHLFSLAFDKIKSNSNDTNYKIKLEKFINGYLTQFQKTLLDIIEKPDLNQPSELINLAKNMNQIISNNFYDKKSRRFEFSATNENYSKLINNAENMMNLGKSINEISDLKVKASLTNIFLVFLEIKDAFDETMFHHE